MAINGRVKGRAAEHEVIRLLQPILNRVYQDLGLEPPTMKRNLEQVRGGGYDLVGLSWLALEVKRQENINVPLWWAQTIRQAGKTKVPVLVYRRNRERWKVVMKARLHLTAGEPGYLARAEISWDDFVLWLEKRLHYELAKKEESTVLDKKDDSTKT
jgi:hypothetical protein